MAENWELYLQQYISVRPEISSRREQNEELYVQVQQSIVQTCSLMSQVTPPQSEVTISGATISQNPVNYQPPVVSGKMTARASATDSQFPINLPSVSKDKLTARASATDSQFPINLPSVSKDKSLASIADQPSAELQDITNYVQPEAEMPLQPATNAVVFIKKTAAHQSIFKLLPTMSLFAPVLIAMEIPNFGFYFEYHNACGAGITTALFEALSVHMFVLRPRDVPPEK